MSEGFKKVNFYNYKEDGKFGITFKHNDQMYELQCTDDGGSFAFDFVPCIKVADNKYEWDYGDSFAFDFVPCKRDARGEVYVWDYENPIFDNLISKGKIKKMGE